MEAPESLDNPGFSGTPMGLLRDSFRVSGFGDSFLSGFLNLLGIPDSWGPFRDSFGISLWDFFGLHTGFLKGFLAGFRGDSLGTLLGFHSFGNRDFLRLLKDSFFFERNPKP